MACHIGIVRDEHDGNAVRVQGIEQAHDALGGRRVEGAGGLVGQHNLGAAHERARDGDALLLPARQLLGGVSEPVAEADLLEASALAMASGSGGRVLAYSSGSMT